MSTAALPQPIDFPPRVADDRPTPATGVSETEIILAWVRALAVRRMAWLEHLDEGNGNGQTAPEHDLYAALADLDSPERENRWTEAEPRMRSTNLQIDAYAKALRADTKSPVGRVSTLLGLSEAERDLFHVCLALELDPTLAPAFARLQRSANRGYATQTLAARLTGRPRQPLLSRAQPLLRWKIIEASDVAPGEPQALRVDPHIVDVSCGRMTVDPALLDAATYLPPRRPLADWPVDAIAERIGRALGEGMPARITVVGQRGSGRRTFAAGVAARLGTSAIAIDTAAITDADWPDTYTHAQRQGVLFGTSLVWHGDGLARRRLALPFVAPLQFVVAEPDFNPPREPGAFEERIALPRLSIEERSALWRELVPLSAAWPAGEVERLADRFALQVGDIAAIGGRRMLELRDAQETCRAIARDRLGELGQLVESPFRREDLVLSESLDRRLDEFLFEARERGRFWENPAARRLFPRGTGLVALLTGTSGTGKTMTAQVVAAELGLDLFRIDLAASISKYIGETAKNLRRIFARAEEMSAVLLFDEADALFSKRTEVRDSHDRYANTDTNYLLQLVEDFRGIALLSTNKRENMDAAFLRRIRYVLDFTKPTATERLAIWRRIVGELAGEPAVAKLGTAMGPLAHGAELSGAQIKLAMLSAIFAARSERVPIALRHLLHGVSRELAKEGRAMSPKDRERIERYG
jgi:hypothetical protein